MRLSFTPPIPLGKNVTLTINIPGKIHREIVYTVASLNREKAIEVAHKLRAVEDAELASLPISFTTSGVGSVYFSIWT